MFIHFVYSHISSLLSYRVIDEDYMLTDHRMNTIGDRSKYKVLLNTMNTLYILISYMYTQIFVIVLLYSKTVYI